MIWVYLAPIAALVAGFALGRLTRNKTTTLTFRGQDKLLTDEQVIYLIQKINGAINDNIIFFNLRG